MKIQVVYDIGSGFVTAEFDAANALVEMATRGFVYTGKSRSYEGINGAVPREMLWNQPTYEGLCGPMYGGPGCLRYESWKVYNSMCD